MKYSYLLILPTLALFSCQSTPGSEEDQAIAKERCKCMKPVLEINRKTERLMRQGEMEQVHALFAQIERINKEKESCEQNIVLKYGTIEGEKKAQIRQVMWKSCPDIARMIEQGEAMEQ